MSNQEIKNKNNTKEKSAVDKRRRFIKGAGVAAPVVLTLASSPVFGAPCLSNIMSGNLSDPGRGSCIQGVSPGAWTNPGGKIGSDRTIDAWVNAGFSYADINSTLTTNSKGKGKDKDNQCKSYTGGTTFSEAFGSGDIRPMREILCEDSGSEIWHLVAAMLNASYFKGSYILTPAQVKGLWNGSISLPPPYTNLNDFLDSTWN